MLRSQTLKELGCLNSTFLPKEAKLQNTRKESIFHMLQLVSGSFDKLSSMVRHSKYWAAF